MMKMLASLALLLAAGAGAQAPPAPRQGDDSVYLPAGARIRITSDPAALARLRRNGGITLQWISWARRGRLEVRDVGGTIELHGVQEARRAPGRLTLDGRLIYVLADRLLFQGRIVITDTPDVGRNCVRDGTYEFRATQRRRYWRLQDFEACDGLADYVDIYF